MPRNQVARESRLRLDVTELHRAMAVADLIRRPPLAATMDDMDQGPFSVPHRCSRPPARSIRAEPVTAITSTTTPRSRLGAIDRATSPPNATPPVDRPINRPERLRAVTTPQDKLAALLGLSIAVATSARSINGVKALPARPTWEGGCP